MQIHKSLLILFGGVLSASTVFAQPVQVTHWTIEAKVAQADNVIVAAIVEVARDVVASPGERTAEGYIAPEGQSEYTIVLKVGEALKGSLKGNVNDLRSVKALGGDKRYEEWMKARTSLLCFLGPTPPAGERRTWELLPLGKRVPAEDLYGPRVAPPMFSADFTVLADDEAVLARARTYAKSSKQLLPIHVIAIPPAIARQRGSSGPWNDLLVPVEPALEVQAKRMIAAPQDFLPKDEQLDALGRYQLRFGGVHALRHFKSEANAELLRSLLAEPLEEFESGFVAQYPLRAKAFEILLHWRLETPLPSSPEEITSLDLSGTQVADAGLKQVARLKNLARLELQSTPVTAAGLRELAGLTRISELHLGESQLSDANLRALREIGLLHVVYQAEAKDAERPRSMEEVRSLALCRSPVTDAGLKELAGMQNLTWLDLRDTQVTDAGLKELVRFKQLGRLLLQGTRVTNAGVAELRKTLPQCEVVRE